MHADSDQGTDTDTDRSGVLLCEEETQVGESLLFSRDQLTPEDVSRGRRRTGEKDSFGSGDRADFIGLAVTEEVDCAERPDRSQNPGMSHRSSSCSSTRSSDSSPSVHSAGQMSDRQSRKSSGVESGLSSEHEWDPPAVQKRSKDAASTKADLNGSPEILVREKVSSLDLVKSSAGEQQKMDDQGIMSADDNVWSARKERMSAVDQNPSLPGETDRASDENISSANADERLVRQDKKSALDRISANSAEKERHLADEDKRSTAEDRRSSDEDKSSADEDKRSTAEDKRSTNEDKSLAADEDKRSADEDRSSDSVCMKSVAGDKESSIDDCAATVAEKSSATSNKKPTREKLSEVEGRQVNDQKRSLDRPSSAAEQKPLPGDDRLVDPERASSGCDSPDQERSSSSSEQSRREGTSVLQALLWNRNHRNRNFFALWNRNRN
jgi:hypothetical protein